MSDTLDRIPHTVLREGAYRVHLTLDLLRAPHLADSPDAYVHGVAIQTFMDALARAEVPLDMARTTVVLTTAPDENLEALGMKKYTWTFTFPVPLFHPATTI